MTRPDLAADVARLRGPVLVLGASGFVGANLLRALLRNGADAYGTSSRPGPWRLDGLAAGRVIVVDLLAERDAEALLDRLRPATVFDCVAHGAYPFQSDVGLIYRTNVERLGRLVESLHRRGVHRFIHAGSSSEYGDMAAGPGEDVPLRPNSPYSASKGAAAGILRYAGTKLGLPCANLRLYSVYGPYEEPSRLVPTALRQGLAGAHAEFVDPATSRDFVYVDDVCEAFVRAAVDLPEAEHGASFNIGTGVNTTIGDFAAAVSDLFELEGAPRFNLPGRDWDLQRWFADPRRAAASLGWTARTDLAAGLRATAGWLASRGEAPAPSARHELDGEHSVSAVIACYRDEQAIPIMYDRLKTVFERLGVDHEIVFVNDASPDASEAAIRALSARDPRVVGITHSRNFGSQAAFRSGMAIATKNSCVLLDGDLQDPPELIADFVALWRQGHEVVYGRRVDREAPQHMRLAYKAFYWLFQKSAAIAVPRDAGDFALMDRRVVRALLAFPERDLFLRGLRAYAGFRQVGVDYVRPERMFGVSTNNLLRNIGWAKKGILSFSRAPLDLLTAAGAALLTLSLLLGLGGAVWRLTDAAGPGATAALALTVAGFGSLNLLALGLIGEYVAKLFEEAKARPHFIRRSIISGGEVRDAGEADGLGAVL